MERKEKTHMVIKVPLQKYISTLAIIAAHVILIGLLAHFFLPQFSLNSIILLGTAFYVFKVINYLVASIHVKENSIVSNGFFKRGKVIPYGAIQEAELEGPSQFNSNYMLALYGERQSNLAKRQVLSKIPIYWFSRGKMVELLNTIKENNYRVQYQKQVSLFMIGEYWKTLLVNYLIQYVILAVIIIVIVMKYN
jgi:hypothetical protein